jgi:hypothetical protein
LSGTRQYPRDFEILGTNDSTAWNDAVTSNKWAVVGSLVDYPKPSASYVWSDTFTLYNPGFYRYYRFRLTRCWIIAAGAGEFMLGQIELDAVKE